MLAMFYILITYYQAFNRQNPSLLEDLFQETINEIMTNMANIDHFHGDEMRHM